MEDFMMLFRQSGPSPVELGAEALREMEKKWYAWVKDISAEGKFISHGTRLAVEGKVLRPGGVVSDGPFVEIKEKLGGFMIVKAESLEDALTLAHGCPVLELGGCVEIRPVYKPVRDERAGE